MAKGQSFLNTPDKTSRGKIRHLNVVITEPDNDNYVLVVPVCTYREKDGNPFPGQDDSCLLPSGCHPFIKVKSYIKYHNALAMSLIDIFNGIHTGHCLPGRFWFWLGIVEEETPMERESRARKGQENNPYILMVVLLPEYPLI